MLPSVTRNGWTSGSTSSAVAGIANAPSGVIVWPRRWFSAAACRPSTEWIESAASRIAVSSIAAACPRYAAAPRF
jgi:hypothetical protein